jgi:2-phosphosulfolactate phosphatase
MSATRREVVIDCFPESLSRYGIGWAVVAIDVIRATTTAVTAVVSGRECYPVASLEAAVAMTARLQDPLLVGELGGNMPYGFHLNNSPFALAQPSADHRPVILLSTAGTQLLSGTGPREAVYAACLRNYTAQVDRLIGRHERVAVIGAGTRGEFREEDQIACARIADGLIRAGYTSLGGTERVVARWRGAPVDAFVTGKSVEYLRNTGQMADLSFILGHIDDVDAAFQLDGDRLVAAPAGWAASKAEPEPASQEAADRA